MPCHDRESWYSYTWKLRGFLTVFLFFVVNSITTCGTSWFHGSCFIVLKGWHGTGELPFAYFPVDSNVSSLSPWCDPRNTICPSGYVGSLRLGEELLSVWSAKQLRWPARDADPVPVTCQEGYWWGGDEFQKFSLWIRLGGWDSVARYDKRHVSYVVLQTQLTHWRLVSPALEILCFYLMCRSSGTIHTRCIDSGCTLAPSPVIWLGVLFQMVLERSQSENVCQNTC